ncbi:C1 family peptidase [Sphingomonas sp. CARO-RG-8B-R24-01]|uniref:C1 family peptidase n=1 Tax=Sphingomonas sp. CARO-RG-8B-R24-01 TaxID=2914831 RepID=UPI001F5A0027|nr:C1 family peptidase [Sphingomonas sp. CARO-RG-8B-R24-01]
MNQVVTHCDLRPLFGPARDQRGRSTCVAFAASDTHAALRGDGTALCCEYAFFHGQRRAKRPPTQGAHLPTMLEVLAKDGQPAETAWPYLAMLPTDLATWVPPTPIGALHGRAGMMSSSAIESVIAALNAGKPVILLLMLSPAFFQPNPQGIVDPALGEVPEPARRHAVIACGHGVVDGKPALLVRNSWGPRWAISGCGWLTEAFLKPRLFAAATLLEDIDVRAHSIAA